ncbi:MAG: HAD-IC family P-type ATPase [Clostridiales bacterium]|jgi:cation-transporting ATPase E|nr:HAD-IC family P-type ATPase [Clostridiales bacterium]
MDYSNNLDNNNVVTIEQMQRQRKKKRPKKILKTVDLSHIERYQVEFNVGLDDEQIYKRNEQGLYNKAMDVKGKTYKGIFFSNLFTFFNFLTFGIAVALLLSGAAAAQLFFMLIIIINITLGIWQECRAKHIVGKLTLVSAPTATVVRKKSKSSIPIDEVVLDDVIFLTQGKQVPSDSIVIRGEIEVNEAMLTGESVPIQKKHGDMVLAGSFVSAGNCYAKVEKVGSANYSEQLASQAKRYKRPRSELQNSIRQIIKVVSIFIFPIIVLLMFFGLRDSKPIDDIIFSISGSIIGMIPAGMFLLTSVALFVGQSRLAKKHVLVQDLYCIEMLARVNVLCLDKTGTITDGTMQVNKVIEIKANMPENFGVKEIISSMLSATKDNNQTALSLAEHFGYASASTKHVLKLVEALPFSSQRKMSVVEFEGEGTFFLGAPEFVLKDMGQRLEKLVEDHANEGFRVLVLAQSSGEIKGSEKLPLSSTRKALALIIVEDHIREDAYGTIEWFKNNNVNVKVISGDNPITVSEVAKRVGIEKAELYLSLHGLSDQEVIEAASKYTVFGRVTPEQKKLLVKALKSKGNTVAMTGDGVNDILAMRESDCAISIASGSEAARNASHLVLMDSNFGSMPNVVAEGRRVINNIQKSSSLFLMKTMMSIGLTAVVLFNLAIPRENPWMTSYPLYTNNLLPMELLVIGIPSTFLALQANKSIISGKFISNVLSQSIPGGFAILISILSIYFFREQLGIPSDSTGNQVLTSMLVLVITFTGLIVLFRISQPLDTFRTVLVVLMVSFSLIILALMGDFFGVKYLPTFLGGAESKNSALSFTQTTFLFAVILSSYSVISLLVTTLKKIKV